jgi:hypothetical protein
MRLLVKPEEAVPHEKKIRFTLSSHHESSAALLLVKNLCTFLCEHEP